MSKLTIALLAFSAFTVCLSTNAGMDHFILTAKQLKCELCHEVIQNSEVWESKSSMPGRKGELEALKHCIQHSEEKSDMGNKHAYLFACHDFAQRDTIAKVIERVKAGESTDAVCSLYCNSSA